jgi:hypothetical protein
VFEYARMTDYPDDIPGYSVGDAFGKVAPANPNNVQSGNTFIFIPGFPPCEDEQPAPAE